ncbi:hypothetical protein COS64_01845 [archaeon CG06_land_8_20_14_3_00_37_11]|nr:MAG: hypothetical protein COS64_01845 [archaeon CG06_land_8_20_14_3_00_37_11]
MVSKRINYGKLAITIESIENKNSFSSKKAENNDEFLIINLALKNNATVQTIIFPDEEIRIIISNKIFPLENYKFENNLDPAQESRGYLLFTIPKDTKKCNLQFGKTALPKTNTELKF